MSNKLTTVRFSANGSLPLCKASDLIDEAGSAVIAGDFGGGSFKFQTSIDDGINMIDEKMTDGTVYEAESNDRVPFTLDDALGSECVLYGTLTGATDPDLTVTIFTGLRHTAD